MRNKYQIVLFLVGFLLILYFSVALSDTVRISQIDNSTLLINQKVKVYVSVTDQRGNPVPNLTEKNFTLYEMGNRREISAFERGVNINQGIKLLLVLDNSGSMYWDGSGRIKDSSNERIWRITYAKEAVSSLLNEIKNPLDRMGLVSFNVKIDSKPKLTNDKGEVAKVLESIKKPAEEEAYTELYETLYHSVDYLRTYRGRKIIILLSDGQDFPLGDNPNFPKRYGMDGAIANAQQEGISVFTIGLSAKADRKNLRHIAEETGGAYFSVYDPGHLKNLYNLIREQILHEYLLTYAAEMKPAEKKLVKVVYSGGDGVSSETQRFYFSGTIFGFGQDRLGYLTFLFVPASLTLLWVLYLCKFEKKEAPPSLTVHTLTGRKTQVHTFPVTKARSAITIGGSESSDVTISGDPKVKLTEARITAKDGVYTISSVKSPITINNKPVKTKVLRSGDLIKLGDTQVVFDAGVIKVEDTDKQKKATRKKTTKRGKK